MNLFSYSTKLFLSCTTYFGELSHHPLSKLYTWSFLSLLQLSHPHIQLVTTSLTFLVLLFLSLTIAPIHHSSHGELQ